MIKFFPLSLSGSAFTWFASLQSNPISGWVNLEKKFHKYFFLGVEEMRLSDLTAVQKWTAEFISDYIQWFSDVHIRCFSLNQTDQQLIEIAFEGLIAPISWDKFSSQEFDNLANWHKGYHPMGVDSNRQRASTRWHRWKKSHQNLIPMNVKLASRNIQKTRILSYAAGLNKRLVKGTTLMLTRPTKRYLIYYYRGSISFYNPIMFCHQPMSWKRSGIHSPEYDRGAQLCSSRNIRRNKNRRTELIIVSNSIQIGNVHPSITTGIRAWSFHQLTHVHGAVIGPSAHLVRDLSLADRYRGGAPADSMELITGLQIGWWFTSKQVFLYMTHWGPINNSYAYVNIMHKYRYILVIWSWSMLFLCLVGSTWGESLWTVIYSRWCWLSWYSGVGWWGWWGLPRRRVVKLFHCRAWFRTRWLS
jgi:hypothetical protein